MTGTRRPTLLNSCARAATATEARFRIDGPEPPARAARVIALDPGAAAIVSGLTRSGWQGAACLEYRGTTVLGGDGHEPDVVLHPADGDREVRLSDALDAVDLVVMVATAVDGAAAAAAVGDASQRRGIMTGGLVFGDGPDVQAAVAALRPHAQVLLVSQDEDDLPAVLGALRA